MATNICDSTIELYETVQEAVVGKLSVDMLIQKLNQLISSVPNKEDVIDSLADILFHADSETNLTNKEQKNLLLNIIKSTIKCGVLPPSVALERFDIDTVALVGVIPDKKACITSYNRLRTRLYFKQRKYNLLREESEGFAKIIVQLDRLSADNGEQILKSVTEIIGAYSVDPNRVLDLILEVFEANPRSDPQIYINFIKSFYHSPTKLTQLISLKLNFYTDFKVEPKIIPQSFYRLVAILISREVIDLEDIYAYLMPQDAKLLDYHQKLVTEAKAFAKKYSMAVVGDQEKPNKSVSEELSPEDRHFLETDNHKINLCAQFIEIADWDQALSLTRKLPEYYCFSNSRVAKNACDLISYIIDPIYRQCGLPEPLNTRIKPIPPRRHAPKQITDISELSTTLFPMLTALGPFLSADVLLLTKMIRILRFTLLQKQDDLDLIQSEKPLLYDILDVINDSILPSVSLSGSNCCLARELWGLIRLFKYHTRYKLYYNWSDEGLNPTVLRCRGQALLKAKHHMKRLSRETLRLTARHLGKLCYSNPVITINYILVQIQSYDNLIQIVVDASRFLPPIAIDTLLYCIIATLSDPKKEKKSLDGMALAPWLTGLSNFSANIILRYKVEFTSFLEYIANQLKSGNSLDLILLTDLIQKMTGIETIQAITDDRIEALMGGDVLRTECAYFNQVKNTRKSSARLKDALIESRLAMPLCILMAQLRDILFFNQNDGTPLKLVGKLYDQCQETLVQYGVFMSTNLSIDDYINFLPPLDKLMTEYRLDSDSAFFLARPMIFHKIKSKFQELKDAATKEIVAEEGESPELSSQDLSNKFVEAAKSVIDPIAEAIKPILIEKYCTNNLDSRLFVIFWTLSMSDIEVQESCYDREIQRLKTILLNSCRPIDDDQRRRKERERCTNLIQKLEQEKADQIEHTQYIRHYMESEKNNLFCESGYVYPESRQFVQHCPFARSILTAYDAIYSARFLLFLHELRVENYPTIICLDRLLCDLTYMMGACTENEANHYGRFLCNILKTTAYWHSKASTYKEQCESYPGSIINIESSVHISYDNYRDICYKWHYRLTRAFTVALESNNYVQIRNALVVMISVIDYYPAIKHFGKGIGKKIEEVRNNEKEKRQDLYALATAYAGRLEEKKPNLIPESDFHAVDTVKAPSSGSGGNPNNTNSNTSTNNNSINSSGNNNSNNNNSTTNTNNSTNNTNNTSTSSSHSHSRSSSRTRPASPSSSSRERHSSSSSRKRVRHN